MADFNFTVRATDSLGAYAERDFSIRVNNKLVNEFVAVGANGDVLTSITGTSWVRQQGVLSGTITSRIGDVISGNGFWLISNATTYMRSPDGLTWTSYPYPNGLTWGLNVSSDNGVKRMWAYGNGKVAALLWDTTISRNVFVSSEDGINWTVGGIIDSSSRTLSTNLAYGNGVWLANNYQTTTSSAYVWRSTDDGATFNPVSRPATLGAASTNTINVQFQNGFFFGSSGSTIYAISRTGLTWTNVAYPGGASFNLFNLSYNNGWLMHYPEAYATSGTAWNQPYRSNDCITWEPTPGTVVVSNTLVNSASYVSYQVSTNTALNRILNVSSNGITLLSAAFLSGANGLGTVYSANQGQTWQSAGIMTTDGGTTPLALVGLASLRLVDTGA